MKNKKIINGICYVITAALAVFYLATLVLGQKREVSKEYDLYYVDGELSRWPGEHGLDYSFGDVDIYDTSKLDEYKRLLEEEKLYGNPSDRDESDEADDKEFDKDKVESNRDSAIDKYFQKMLAAQTVIHRIMLLIRQGIRTLILTAVKRLSTFTFHTDIVRAFIHCTQAYIQQTARRLLFTTDLL